MKKFKKIFENAILFFLVLGFIWPLAMLFYQNVPSFEVPIPIALASTRVPMRTKPVQTVSITAVPESIGAPVRFKIPSIGVDAAVDSVGLLPDGSMGAPKIPHNVAWFELGPRPGETGTAAISGHVNWWNGNTAVFAKLNKLKPGDIITVQDDKGSNIFFKVRESRNYNAAADASDVFFSNDGNAHLSLITCSGVWNKRAKQYSQRLVVFADKE